MLAPTVGELAERIRAVIATELSKLERSAASAPLNEVETRRLRDLAAALKLASIAGTDAVGRQRRAWLNGRVTTMNETPAKETRDE